MEPLAKANYYCPTFSSQEIKEFKELKSSLEFNYLLNKIIPYKFCAYKGLKPNSGSYRKDANKFIKINNRVEEVFLMSFGDIQIKKNLPVFIKTRNVGSRCGILLPFNSARHWKFPDDLTQDIAWDLKTQEVIWRGAPTGGGLMPKRVAFVKQYSSRYNIWLSHLGRQGKDEWTNLVKGKIAIAEQLQYKYILSLEGNDVATNLKWILASNSVPIMPVPTKESWLMEGSLIPYFHYVPLANDLSNLQEVLQWCRLNDSLCQKIAENGQKYIRSNFNSIHCPEMYNLIYSKYRFMLNLF